jgi:hypothetical protein
MDSETTAFAARVKQERQTLEATTNQKIKSYEAMNDQLQLENKAIKACCNSQAVQAADCRTPSPSKHQTKPIHTGSPDGLRPQAQRTSNASDNVELTRAGFQKSNIAPKNLLETLTKSQNHQMQHRSPA